MSEIEEFEKNIINIYEESNKITQIEKNNSINSIKQLFSSSYSVEWTIAHFEDFKNNLVQYKVIYNLSYWCKYSWDQIDEDIYPQIKHFLFEYLPINFLNFNNNTKKEIGKSQFIFFTYFYPENWPDFFNLIFSLENSLPYFLLELFYNFSYPDPLFIINYQNIFNQMNLENIFENIFKFIFLGISKKDSIYFDILSYYSLICDESWLYDQSLLSIFVLGLQDSLTLNSSINCIDFLMTLNLNKNLKFKLYEEFRINELLICEGQILEFYIQCSHLIYTLGMLFDDINIIENLLLIAIDYFNFEDHNIIENITLFFYSILHKSNSFVESILNSCFIKLVQLNINFNLNEYLSDFICKTIGLCFIVDKTKSLELFLLSFNEINPLNDPAIGSSFLKILYEVFRLHMTDESMFTILSNNFFKLLDINDNFPQEYYNLYFNFIKMPLKLFNYPYFTQQIIFEFLSNSLIFYFNINHSEEIRNSILQISLQISRLFKKNSQPIDINFISNLLESNIPDIIIILTHLLITYSGDSYLELINKIFLHFTSQYQINNQKSDINNFLIFLQKINPINNSDFLNNVTNHLTHLFESNLYDDKIISNIILSTICCSIYSFPLFNKFKDQLFNGYIQLNTLNSLALSTYKFIFMAQEIHKQNPNNNDCSIILDTNWFLTFFSMFLNVFENHLRQIFSIEFSLLDLTEIKLFFQNFYQLVSLQILIIKENLILFERIINLTNSLLLRFYDNLIIIQPIYQFFLNLSNQTLISIDLIRQFYYPSLYIFYNKNLTLNNSKFDILILRFLVNIHSNWMKDYNYFSNQLLEFFNNLNLFEDFTSNYLAILEGDKQLIWKPIQNLLENLNINKTKKI